MWLEVEVAKEPRHVILRIVLGAKKIIINIALNDVKILLSNAMIVDIIVHRCHTVFGNGGTCHTSDSESAMDDVVKIGGKLLLYHGDSPAGSLINTRAVEKPV